MISYPMSPARDTSTFVGCQLTAIPGCAMSSDAHLRIASFPVTIGAFGGSSELSSAKNETNPSTSLAPAAFDHWASESRSARSSSARVSGAGVASFYRHATVNTARLSENTRNATHRFRFIELLLPGIFKYTFQVQSLSMEKRGHTLDSQKNRGLADSRNVASPNSEKPSLPRLRFQFNQN